MKTKILDRYLSSQIFWAAFFGVIIFIVIWISPEILFRIIRRIVNHQVTITEGVKLFFLEIPAILGKAIPVGLLLGSLFVTDTLSRNFELVTLRSIGVSFLRIAMPVAIIGLVGTVICFFVYDTLIPYSTNAMRIILDEQESSQFVYLEKDANFNPKQVIIIANFDGKTMENINVFQINKNTADPSMKTIIFAKSAFFKGNEMVLKDVTNYKISDAGIYQEIKKFPELSVLQGKAMENAKQLMILETKKPDELDQKEIKSYLKLLKEERLSDEFNYILNKLYQRYAQAFSCLVFAITGVILGWSRPRENRFLGFTVGAAIIFAYYLVTPFIDLLAQKEILPPMITAWLPVSIIAIGMYYYAKAKDL